MQKQRKEKSIVEQLKQDINKLNGLCEKPKWFKTGWPDLLVFIPGGFFWMVETKRPVGGKLSPRQIVVHRELRELHFKVRVIHDNETKNLFLNEIRKCLEDPKRSI